MQLQLHVGIDNEGNAYALRKWSTTKHPFCLILMELSIDCRLRNISLDLSWISREQNCTADNLSNGITHAFQECNRINPDLATLKWHVFDERIESANELYLDISSRKKTLAKKARLLITNTEVAKSLKRSKAHTLKITQPWNG